MFLMVDLLSKFFLAVDQLLLNFELGDELNGLIVVFADGRDKVVPLRVAGVS
jgi:hypothetical protein